MTMSSNSYPWFSSEEKTYQWLLAKNERVQATVDQCAASQMKYSGPKGKGKKKIWTRLIKPISVISAFHIFTEKQLSFWIIHIYLDYDNFVMQDLL